MEYLLEAPVRLTVSSMLGLAGFWLGLRGLQGYVVAVRLPATDGTKSLSLIHAFRVVIIGISTVGLSIALAGEILWLAILSLVVLGEETFETTMAIGAMNYGKPRKPTKAHPPAAS